MQNVSLENDISILQLPIKYFNAMKRKGVNTVGDMIRIKRESGFKGFYLREKGISEIEQLLESLYTGANGYIISTNKDEIIERNTIDSATPQKSNAENVKSVQSYDDNLIQELAKAYKLEPDICSEMVTEARKRFTSVPFTYRLYENETLYSSLHSKILSILGESTEGVSKEILMRQLPEHLMNRKIVERMLHTMAEHGELNIEGDMYVRILPSIVDYVHSNVEDKRKRQILLDRLNGDTLEQIGGRNDITRERVRQICVNFFRTVHQNGQHLKEDKYRYIVSKYEISREIFTLAFDESVSTYVYLDAAVPLDVTVSSKKIPVQDALHDEKIPVHMRRQLEMAIYRDYITIDGQRIRKNRQLMVNYYVKTYCRELTKFDDFEAGYTSFLSELGLSDNDKLQINGSSCENHLSICMYVLWNQWRRFRYYDIQSRDYGDFLETINLMQYNGMEITTLKLFRDNPELMDEYDIHDEYELHNLLKKIWNESDGQVNFTKMPTIEIGVVDRDKQVLSLLLRYTPVSTKRLSELYEEEYGVKAQTMIANYLKNFDKYFFNGMYCIESRELPENEFSLLSEDLTDDYYTIQDVQKIYRLEFPNADITLINPYTLKTLGFRVYSGYIVRNTYSSASDYFNHILTEQDVIDTRDYPKSIQSMVTFNGEMRRLRQEREIVEFAPGQYINIRKLEQFGVTKEVMEDYCRKVNDFVGRGAFFTIHSINSDEFYHSLNDLGFDENFYSSVLLEDQVHFSYQRLGGTRIFFNGKSKNIIADLLMCLINDTAKKDIYELRDLLENRYGIVLNKSELISIIRSTDMYYSEIMEAAYIDYDTYFEEV